MALFFNFALMQKNATIKFEAEIILYRNGENKKTKIYVTDKDIVFADNKKRNIPITQLQKVSKSPGRDTVVVLHTSNGVEEYDYIFSLTSLEQSEECLPDQIALYTLFQVLREVLESLNKTLPVEQNARIECIRNCKKKTLEIICCKYENLKFYRFFKIGDIIEYNVPIICGISNN